MKVKVESSKILKPLCEGYYPSTDHAYIPLSVFDTVTFDTHVAVLYAFRPPSPSNSAIQSGLARALAVYREWAGRLGADEDGNPVILLNDEGVRLVEASVDLPLCRAVPFKPSAALLSLHPGVDGVAELVQVQLTRFACGSLVVGFTAHHHVADGHATSNFLVAWGLASRGLAIPPRSPLRDRATLFAPRDPPRVEFEHRGVEFTTRKQLAVLKDENPSDGNPPDIAVHKAHFTREFLTSLKAKASLGAHRQFTTFECLVAHLWRAVTKARTLPNHQITFLRISVNGRMRIKPRVPKEFFGNCVLWAFPRAAAGELVSRPLRHAAGLIHEAVAGVDDAYFRSFVDFASSGGAKAEGLVPTAEAAKVVMCPNLELDSWLGFPFYDLDFGGGSPFYFMPTYSPMEGTLFLLPSFMGDGSVEAYVSLFDHSMASFKRICHSLDY
ncbi:agmatine coumaroyltransferase-2-like [Ananas comosus]|uniref:Agmatine coumaroyltransferase-2 n=1 Tax=Ananas comosus TaxID=4615 RepID=A0A199V3P4_ANACO|nr:agmatine coumaroyltransferase-2-like [Ananas comosus]OAY71526.1 Agmatine coumaroyltransferase-2 [Ananas comosus]